MPCLTINGDKYELPQGIKLLEGFRLLGIEVPNLCFDERIKPYGACKLCVVEVEGEARPVTSCETVVREGMIVHTHTEEVERLRRTQLRLLAEHYSVAATIAEPDRPFHEYLSRYGVTPGNRLREDVWSDDTHPYIRVDMNRCIFCFRCVRICAEVQGQFVWQTWGRGSDTRVRPASGTSLLTSDCTSCGACADSCPSGALTDTQVMNLGEPEKWTTTTCVYCGVGCQMQVGSRAGKVVSIRPANGAVNRGHLCVKGRYAFEFATSAERATQPMIRKEGDWEPVSWEEALDFSAAELKKIIARSGPDSVGVLGSSRGTNEENYLIQKFARLVVGTNNIDCCARVCHTPSAAALKLMFGTGAATSSFDDIEKAALIMVCGANPTENHPIVGARIKQAVLNGAKLIVVDPRKTELAGYADIHLAPLPGLNIPLFNAMACTIIEEGLVDRSFITERVDSFDSFSAFITQFRPEAVAESCGVAAGAIRSAARLYAETTPSICFHGLGMTEHLQGTEGVMTLINLALLTGNVGKPGAGVNPLRGQNNVQGSAQMGCDPGSLTGSQDLEKARDHFEKIWGAPIPQSKGMSLIEMVDAAAEGKLKALWAFGYDIYATLPNCAVTAEALGKLDLVIVQDLFLTETAKRFGTVFFPAASVFERDGTFMNSDRRVQRVRSVVPPPGEARPDGWIITELAKRCGGGEQFAFTDSESVWNEVRSVWPGGAGLSYARIDNESLHWPCPTEEHPGTPVLHAEEFALGRRTALRSISYIPTTETVSEEYPFLLTTGRNLYHFNAGTMTYRTQNSVLQPTDYLDISPGDAAALLIESGDRILVRSRYGAAELPVRITTDVNPGIVFSTFHLPALFVNRVTSSVRDRYVKAPEYKVTAVSLARIDADR